tara:strand:+ start:163 stop:546 length:384 start_codon:yes stop_codon:yes gene_type:complete
MLFLGFISRIQILIILLFCLGCGTVTQNNSQTCENDGMINFTYINIPCKNCIYLIQDILDSNKAIFNYDITENNMNEQIYLLINYCYNQTIISPDIIEQELIDNGFVINEKLSEQKITILNDRCCNI